MNDLMALWKSRVGAILGIVQAGGTEHREVASMAAQVGADYHGRFIVELLQNASDQATEAGLCESCVTIIRTAQFVAFANEGIEFKEKGLRSITSLGLSTKRPQDAIGNKGVGFKSVFQVSESPEIYSSPSSSESFADAQGLMFKLSLTPFADPSLEETVREIVTDQLVKTASVDVPLTVDEAMSEMRAAAPFKFPLPLSKKELSARLVELSEVPNSQTMILLPLRQTPETMKTVGLAIDELFEEAGAAILFLPSVSKIKIVDKERAFTRTISRQPVTAKRQIDGFGQVSTVVTTSVREDGTINERSWRLIEREMGKPDVVPPEQAAKEAECINTRARKLPGMNWDTVRSSPIGVAVPLQMPVEAGGSLLLGTRGRICIGLPTKDPTGTPAWINAHFHGTISRKGIDLKDNSYNELLFGEAVRLHGGLVADLKVDAEVHIRRTVTLAFERGNGPLADDLYSSDGQAKGKVILSIDGRTFQTPSDTVLPEPADVDALLLMVPQTRDLEGLGLRLPDVELTRNARPLIESLIGGKPDSAMVAALLLDRSRNRASVMEHAAQERRGDGPMFWETFLSWVVGRFTIDQLSDQRVLPVGKDAVAKSSERVFLPPSPRRSAEAIANDDGEIEEIPNDLAESLKFLDDAAVAVRRTGMRSLTELASKLAPDTGRGLVRSPRLDHLINDAVGPLMQELKEDEVSKQNGIRLLRQVMHWLWALSETGRERLTRDALRVPVPGASGSWIWVPPSMTYFGSGWLGDPTDSLLQESYGHEPGRLLLPWEPFSSAFGVTNEDRDAWIGALELLGISRSPKLIRPRGPRAAPLISNNYTELSIDYSPCPVTKAERFWRPYLEFTRRRHANTASGQRFNFRSITWIDGLEREESRPTILKLMLLHPESYESETSTFLERQYRQNDDISVVPSLWVHAITANTWKAIPTQRGPVAVADAWLLDGHQRGLARRRLALLNQVEAPYDNAEKLLHGIGVTTLQTASVNRLLHMIGHLGESCADYDAETRRTALALAEDLFSHLQVAYSKSPAVLPDLKSFYFPMERNKVAIGIRGDQILTGYVNDDPVRAGFISNFSEACIWPLDLRHAHRDLVTELRRQLGKSAVVFTSEAPVESGFTEDHGLRRENLLEWLSTKFPRHSVASNLACLIAYTGRVETDPNGEDFKRNWRSFEKAFLVFGEFPADSPTPYFYDRSTGLLQVAAELSDAEKVEATWMLVGPSYRDTWSAYARELERDSPGKFLVDRQITSAQRENVENVIGLSSTERFKHLRAAALILWFMRFGTQPVSRFKAEWDVNARSVRGLCDWLGRSELADIIASVLGVSEEEASLEIIRAVGIDSQEWQQARLALGMERWSFTYKIKAWNDTMTELVSILKTCVARAASVSPADLEPILRDPRLATPPEEIACRAEGKGEVLHATIRQIEVVLNDWTAVAGVDFLRRRLAAVVDQAKVSFATVNLDDAPARDVRVYRDEDKYAEKRSRDAQMRFDGLMVVASALAKQLNEQIIAEDVRPDPRVSLLLHGWWANSFTVIAAIQRVLQTKVPKTAQRMSDERVFRDPAPANELIARFKELAGAGGVKPVAPPKHRITIFGQDQTEDTAAMDLLRGTIGGIGQQLKEKAALQPFDPNLGKGVREKIVLSSGRTKTRGGGGRSAAAEANKKDRELAGLLGEAFVYEYFRIKLPAFDEMAWRSCNRNAYGMEGEGDDSLGFDFSYRDNENLLAGRQDHPLCCIEVKSSTGDGSEPFQMTANEWEKARNCHQATDSVYIILRVSSVRDDPKITDVIIDPFGLYGGGQVAVVSRDMWVHVGVPQSVTDAADDPQPPDSLSESV
jgi:hypothetical protein